MKTLSVILAVVLVAVVAVCLAEHNNRLKAQADAQDKNEKLLASDQQHAMAVMAYDKEQENYQAKIETLESRIAGLKGELASAKDQIAKSGSHDVRMSKVSLKSGDRDALFDSKKRSGGKKVQIVTPWAASPAEWE